MMVFDDKDAFFMEKQRRKDEKSCLGKGSFGTQHTPIARLLHVRMESKL